MAGTGPPLPVLDRGVLRLFELAFLLSLLVLLSKSLASSVVSAISARATLPGCFCAAAFFFRFCAFESVEPEALPEFVVLRVYVRSETSCFFAGIFRPRLLSPATSSSSSLLLLNDSALIVVSKLECSPAPSVPLSEAEEDSEPLVPDLLGPRRDGACEFD